MQNRNEETDDKSVEIRLDDHIPIPKAVTVTRKKRRAPKPKPRPILPPQRPVIGSLGHSTRKMLNEKAFEMYSDDESVYLSDNNDEIVDADNPKMRYFGADTAAEVTTSTDANQSKINAEGKQEIFGHRLEGTANMNAGARNSGDAQLKSNSPTSKYASVFAGLAALGGSESVEVKPSPRRIPIASEPKNGLEDDGFDLLTDGGLTPGLASLGGTEDVEAASVNGSMAGPDEEKGGAIEEVDRGRRYGCNRVLLCSVIIILILIIGVVAGVLVSGTSTEPNSPGPLDGANASGVSGTSDKESQSPSSTPTTSRVPSLSPSHSPSSTPTTSRVPSLSPSNSPSSTPTISRLPSLSPSSLPSSTPTTPRPSLIPSSVPSTSNPSSAPSTQFPSESPSSTPTTHRPSLIPSSMPSTSNPSSTPSTQFPSGLPSSMASTPATSGPSLSESSTPSTAIPTSTPTTTVPTSKLVTSVPTSEPPTRATTVSPTTAWFSRVSSFFSDDFPSTDLQEKVLDQLAAQDTWQPDNTSNNRLYLERFVLSLWFEATGGDRWRLKARWRSPTADTCDWFGVECNSSKRITSVMLQFNNLEGTVPTEIGLLRQLAKLSLQSNALSGKIPNRIGNLSQMTWLDMRNNELSGTIPGRLGAVDALEIVYLSHNDLSGTVPASVEYLAQIGGTKIDLVGNPKLECDGGIRNLNC